MKFTVLLAAASIVSASQIDTFDDYTPNYHVSVVDHLVQEPIINSKNNPYIIQDDSFKYACNISVPERGISANAGNTTAMTSQKMEAIDAIRNFNTRHAGQCIYRELGYWSYRVCFMRDLVQFHYTGDHLKVDEQLAHNDEIPAHKLGYFKQGSFAQSSDFEFVKSSDGSRYISQLVYNGSTCDLTGEPRSIFVQYRCDPENTVPVITDVDELKTCMYRMVVSSAELCQYPVLRSENYITEANISCSPFQPVRDSAGISAEDYYTAHEKIDLLSLHLRPVGNGIFLGMFKDEALPSRPYILVSNKDYIRDPTLTIQDSPENSTLVIQDGRGTQLLSDVANAFLNMMRANIVLTPGGQTGRRPLIKGDHFEFVTEVYGLNREFLANVAVNQTDNGFIVTYFAGYGSIRNNFVSFTSASEKPASQDQPTGLRL